MAAIDTTTFQRAFRDLHHCTAAFVRTDHVTESMNGSVIWERDVQVFTLTDHPTATEGYAWREEHKNGKTETYAVVSGGAIDSPKMAVRATILVDINKVESKI